MQLNLHKIEINAGRSSQSTLLGKNAKTYESLYLSPALVKRLQVTHNRTIDELMAMNKSYLGEKFPKQMELGIL